MAEPAFGEGMRRIVRKRLRRVLRAAPAAIARGRDDELHALRKALKRLRYDLEFAAAARRDAGAEASALLAAIQARLGTLTDAAAFARTYADMLEELPAGDERRAGIEGLLASACRDRARAIAETRKIWRSSSAPYPERLAASISAALGSLSIDEP
jgi:CHAD domain-containing protein